MISLKTKLRLLNYYPPYLGAGIKVKCIDDEFHTFEVVLKMHWWNKNAVGTHFGGSLFSMCDPFFMLILLQNMSRDFIVWDKAASIRFRRPGKGVVKALFHVSKDEIAAMEQEVRALGKKDYTFRTEVFDKEGQVIAEVEKLVHIRLKNLENNGEKAIK